MKVQERRKSIVNLLLSAIMVTSSFVSLASCDLSGLDNLGGTIGGGNTVSEGEVVRHSY